MAINKTKNKKERKKNDDMALMLLSWNVTIIIYINIDGVGRFASMEPCLPK